MKIVVLTGAGVSAESGLGTFRDAGGIWATFDPYELATPEAFARNPGKVHGFYNARRRNLREAEANTAHIALGALQKRLAGNGGELTLVTQNIDDLHERGGAHGVIHMHGELFKARCELCGTVAGWRQDMDVDTPCPACGDSGGMRPHVVWFGEIPLAMDIIADKLADADVFVSIGTSGAVWPAAGFVATAKEVGARTVELNLEPSDGAHLFDEHHYGPATEVVPEWARGAG